MHEIDEPTERKNFEAAIWSYYQNLKQHGWSAPGEGGNTHDALFWRTLAGKYGVITIEAAWNGWKMRAAA